MSSQQSSAIVDLFRHFTLTPAGSSQPMMVAVGVVLGLIMCGSCLLAGVWWKRRYSTSVAYLKMMLLSVFFFSHKSPQIFTKKQYFGIVSFFSLSFFTKNLITQKHSCFVKYPHCFFIFST